MYGSLPFNDLHSHFSSVVPVETKGYNMRFPNLPDFKKIENMMKFHKSHFNISFRILLYEI